MLWTKSEYTTFEHEDARTTTTWKLETARPTYAECLEVKQRVWAVYKGECDDAKACPGVAHQQTIDGELIMQRLKPAKGARYGAAWDRTLECLPATVDPRERR